MGKMGSMQIKGLQEFQQKLQKLQDPDLFLEACTRELAARLLAKVIKRTPVGQYPSGSGKVGGTLHRGWTGGQSSSGAAYGASVPVQHIGNEFVIEFINPVEYASYVEYGHRTANHKGWVKGRFMMTISEDEVRSLAPALMQKRILDYLKGAFS